MVGERAIPLLPRTPAEGDPWQTYKIFLGVGGACSSRRAYLAEPDVRLDGCGRGARSLPRSRPSSWPTPTAPWRRTALEQAREIERSLPA